MKDPLGTLLRRAGRGDQSAFAELYDSLAPLLHGVVLKVVRDPAQSEEVTQEAFVELWRLAPRYDATRGSVKSWAATLAHRRAIDRVRSEQASRERTEREGQKRPIQSNDVAEQVVANIDGTTSAQGTRAIDRDTTAGGGAGVLWRTQLPRGRPAPGCCRRNDQDKNSRRNDPIARRTRSCHVSGIDIHQLAAAYALDAVDERERAEFEAHYPTCPVCRPEVAGFRETLSQVGRVRRRRSSCVTEGQRDGRDRQHSPTLAAAAGVRRRPGHPPPVAASEWCASSRLPPR